MKGYKAFNKDMTCRSMQYEIGKEYKMREKPIICEIGYHFCKTIADCYDYYDMDENTIICEIKALGDIVSGGNKFCTNHILIVRKINNPRKKTNVSISSNGYCNTGDRNDGNRNTGNGNTGDRNTGDGNAGNKNTGNYNAGNENIGNWNAGDWNTGDGNIGNHNTGDGNIGSWNTGNWNAGSGNTGRGNAGDRNAGDHNTGHWNAGILNTGDQNAGNCNAGNGNTGNCNTGSWNAGNWNSGNWNTGDWNTGDYNIGIFCTEKKQKIKLFDKESNWTMDDWLNSNARYILGKCPRNYIVFVHNFNMTDEEKEKHPEYIINDGYYKIVLVTSEDKQKWWDSLSDKDKNTIFSLPNFNKNKFKKCTGIKV